MAAVSVDASSAGLSEDDLVLTRMGYKQELYRGFSAFMR